MCVNKTELRRYIKQLRADTDKTVLAEADKAVFGRVISSDEYRGCSALLAYVSAPIEVDTSMMIAHAFGAGKAVYAPRVIPGTRKMQFCLIESFDDLESGYFGIFEPKQSCPVCDDFDSRALCIVPALAYDGNGYRLGYGKGFYDVFLSSFPGVKLGICYENCMVQTVFGDDYDVPVDILITDKRKMIFDRMIRNDRKNG